MNGVIRDTGHNINAVTEDKTGHNNTPSLTEGTGRAPLWCPFPAACGLFTASGSAPSVSVTGARNDKDKERILYLLEEIWQDDSWLPAA
ncbi:MULTISPECIES: DinI-like family protein [Escherichia]|uniref:DinI-like family protein n=1 Tax=Escherichia TaxID=561 RepID=UPI00278C5DA8|nr:DinI-like family protein [Escherichia coli]